MAQVMLQRRTFFSLLIKVSMASQRSIFENIEHKVEETDWQK